MTWHFFLGIILFLWIYLLWSRRKYYRLIFEIPGPLGYPLLGMAQKLARREDILYAFHKEEQKYGNTFFSWLGPFPFLVVSDPQIAQDILNSPHCTNKSFIYNAIDDGTGRGLFSLGNPEWTMHRRLLTPSFGHKVLLSFMTIFNREVNSLTNIIDELSAKNDVDLMQIIQNFTLNVALQTTMGESILSKTNCIDCDLLRCYKCVLESMTKMCFAPWLSYKAFQWLWKDRKHYYSAKSKIRSYIRSLIVKKTSGESQQEERNVCKLDQNIFVNLAIDLMWSGNFTWQNVEDECNVILFGAFETTANTIVYTLMLLAMFPQYQQKAFEEVTALFPDDGEFEVSYNDIQQMTYIDMVINETMRVMAPVPLVARQSEFEVRLSNDVTLPKGIQIAIDIFNMHRRKDIWGPNAHIFNPENFLPSNLEGKHSYAFIPFTKGIRNCIGWKYALMSTKVTLAKLIKNFLFTTTFKYEDLKFVEDITLKLEKVPHFHIYRRSRNT